MGGIRLLQRGRSYGTAPAFKFLTVRNLITPTARRSYDCVSANSLQCLQALHGTNLSRSNQSNVHRFSFYFVHRFSFFFLAAMLDQLAAGQLAQADVEHWREEQTEQGHADHPSEHGDAC